MSIELKNICIVKNDILPSKGRRRRRCEFVLVAVGRVLNLLTIISVDLLGLLFTAKGARLGPSGTGCR